MWMQVQRARDIEMTKWFLKSLKSIPVGMFVYIYTGVNQETKEIMQTTEVCLPSVFTLCRKCE